MIQDTSLKAYINEVAPTLMPRQIRVLEVFERLPGRDFTNEELSKELEWGINRVTPRVLELRLKGILEDAGKRECKVTKREVHCWRVKVMQRETKFASASTFYQFGSKTNDAGIHIVKDSRFGITCTCTGFYYRKTCSHIEKAMTKKETEKHAEIAVLVPLF